MILRHQLTEFRACTYDTGRAWSVGVRWMKRILLIDSGEGGEGVGCFPHVQFEKQTPSESILYISIPIEHVIS